MLNDFTKEVCLIFENAELEMINLKHPYVGSEHLLLSLLKTDEFTKQIFKNYQIDYKVFKKQLINLVGKASKPSIYILYTPLLRNIITNSIEISIDEGDGVVNSKFLLLALLEEDEGIAINILKSLKVKPKEILKKLSEEPINLTNLNQYATNLNKTIKEEKVIGRDEEVYELINILLKKNKCNPLLVGKSGVGKTAIVEEFVRRINNKQVPLELLDYQVYSLSLGNLISGTKYRGDFESRLTEILKEIENNKIILFVDEIHGITTCGSAEGAVSAGEILKPYLSKGNIKIIGATTEREYNKYLSKDKAIVRRFDLVQIKEPTISQTLEILKGIKKEYEKFHSVKISDQILEEIINFTSKLEKNKSNPDKSIELLDLVCAKVRSNNYVESLNNQDNKIIKITTSQLNKVISDKYKINLSTNKQILDKIKLEFKKIISQTKQKELLLNLINYKLNNPTEIISALLIGNTGVGKTQIVKLIANAINENNILKLDMSEYNLETSINKLIGTSSGYIGYNEYFEFEKIKNNPSTIIIVDEVEKANPKVINLFLSILDEGFLKDGTGELIDFRSTMIFFTSNLGTKNTVGFNPQINNEIEEFFTKELLGRFDAIIKFQDITEKDVLEYISTLNTKIDPEEIIKRSNYQKYGLRNINKVIKSIEIEYLTTT